MLDNCPKCNTNFNGGSIWEFFRNKFDSSTSADRYAEMYGGTKENNKQWRREIGLYDEKLDRTVAYQCPDCGHTWKRE